MAIIGGVYVPDEYIKAAEKVYGPVSAPGGGSSGGGGSKSSGGNSSGTSGGAAKKKVYFSDNSSGEFTDAQIEAMARAGQNFRLEPNSSGASSGGSRTKANTTFNDIFGSLGTEYYSQQDAAGKVRMDNALQAGEAERIAGNDVHSGSWWLALMKTSDRLGIPISEAYKAVTGSSANFELPPMSASTADAQSYAQRNPFIPYDTSRLDKPQPVIGGSGTAPVDHVIIDPPWTIPGPPDKPQPVYPVEPIQGGSKVGNDQSIWEADPEQAYYNQLGIGAYGLTPYEKWQKAQFAPTYATYLVNSRLNSPEGGTAGGITFGDYLAGNGIMGARRASTNLFNQLGNLDLASQRQLFDTTENGGLGAAMNRFMETVLGQRYGVPVGGIMANTFSPLKQYFEGGPGYSNENASFLDYLRSKYNL